MTHLMMTVERVYLIIYLVLTTDPLLCSAARAADHRTAEQSSGHVFLRGAAVGDVHWAAPVGWHAADAGHLQRHCSKETATIPS